MTRRRPLSPKRIKELASDLSDYLQQPDNKGAYHWFELHDIRPADRAKIMTAEADGDEPDVIRELKAHVTLAQEAAHPKPVKAPRKRKAIARKPKRLSKKALKRQCDQLWSELVKRYGRCFFLGREVNGKEHTTCVGGLQAMHLISRRFHATRWDLDNGLPGCAGVHMWYTCNPEAWGLFLARYLGIGVYEGMLTRARDGAKPDLREVLARLQGRREAA